MTRLEYLQSADISEVISCFCSMIDCSNCCDDFGIGCANGCKHDLNQLYYDWLMGEVKSNYSNHIINLNDVESLVVISALTALKEDTDRHEDDKKLADRIISKIMKTVKNDKENK